jgi:hypothetical protein
MRLAKMIAPKNRVDSGIVINPITGGMSYAGKMVTPLSAMQTTRYTPA